MWKKRCIHILVLTVGLAGLLVIPAAGDHSPEESYESYFRYIGTRPTEAENDYSEEAQGITHDRHNWFISQQWALWKVPVSLDLAGSIECGVSGVVCHRLGDVDEIRAYNHVGDIDHYQHGSNGFLLLPLTGESNRRAIAAFSPSNLQYIAHAELPQHCSGSWVAVDPDGLVYTPNCENSYWVYTYRLNWDKLAQDGILSLQKVGQFQLLDESGSPLGANQGGAFSESGNLLYTNNGYWGGYDSHKDGISVFNMQTKRRVAHSTMDSARRFWYGYDPTCEWYNTACEEPEGLTIWDLDDDQRTPEGMSGQLHVLLLDNDVDDDVYIRHYTNKIYVNRVYSGEEWGTTTKPFNTISEAYAMAWDGAQIKIRAGTYMETSTLSKRIQILAIGGDVTIVGE